MSGPSPLPYRGTFGAPRPPGLAGLALPPQPMPSHLGLNPLKAWRWVGVFSSELMLCAAHVRVGPARQQFYAVYDRTNRTAGSLIERTGPRVSVELSTTRMRVMDRNLQLDLSIEEGSGVETITANEHGDGYTWTRKQAPLPASGMLMLDGHPREIQGLALIDDSCGYHARHTHWRWCAGVGLSASGQQLAWNLVEGVHDSPTASERTLWVDGAPRELAPTPIAADLTTAGSLHFHAEVTRTRHENRVLVRSRYRSPFGSFSGAIGDLALNTGYGVMEEHDAVW